MRKRRIISLLMCAMLVAISFCTPCNAFEIFEADPVFGIPLRTYKWVNSNNTYDCYVRCNGDLLTTGTYAANQYLTAFTKWNNLSSNVRAINIAYENSDVKFVTVQSESFWNTITNYNPDGMSINTVPARTYLYDVTGHEVYKHDLEEDYNPNIVSAIIYITPHNEFGIMDGVSNSKQDDAALKTLVHELGHALCLGHPPEPYDDDPYIMNQGFVTGKSFYTAPTANDISELTNKYGS